MKPTKNKVFCRECGRTKMLFEDEKQALTFIKFNSNNFDDRSPIRAYYCEACFGWHVTSREGETYRNPMTETMIKDYNQVKGANNLQGWYDQETQKLFNSLKSKCMSIIKGKKKTIDGILQQLKYIEDLKEKLSLKLNSNDMDLINKMITDTKNQINNSK